MKQPLPIKIVGVGRYLPKRVVTNNEIEEMSGLPIGAIDQTGAGVKTRRWRDKETVAFMGARAIGEAVQDAGMELSDLDLIINASGSPMHAIPDNAPFIQVELGLGNSGLMAMTIHTTCLSWLTAFHVAAGMLNSEQYKTIAIVSSEIASKAINMNEPESFMLFGDCAAATIVQRTPEGEASALTNYKMRTFGSGAYYTCVLGGGIENHPNDPETKPEQNLFHMEGLKVFHMAREHGSKTLEMVRPGLSKGLDDIDWVIPHQASGIAIKALAKYRYPEEKIAVTLDRLGNCIAASIPATLYEVVKDGRLQRGQKALFIGTGAGLSIAAGIITY